MHKGKWALWVLSLSLLGAALACNGLNDRPLPTIAPITATPAATTSATSAATPTAPAEVTPTEAPARTLLAWATGTDLNVTTFGGGGAGDTQRYPISEPVQGLAWSPSGQWLAYTVGTDSPQVYEVPATGIGTPIPIGAGFAPAWSPDEQSLVAERDGNLWLFNPASQKILQLTNQTGWQWGKAVFAPDGSGVIAAGAATDDMGAQGNVEFYLYKIPLDGSGSLNQLEGPDGGGFFGRLPYDLQLSPDGQHLAFSTSAHVDVCASPVTFYVGGADGKGWQEITSPTINAAVDSEKDIYQEGLGLTWMPDSQAVALDSYAWDCSAIENGGDPKTPAGPLLAIVGLDGAERATLPIDLANLSVNHSGSLLAGLVYPPDGSAAHVKVYSLSTGEGADFGEGTAVLFQP